MRLLGRWRKRSYGVVWSHAITTYSSYRTTRRSATVDTFHNRSAEMGARSQIIFRLLARFELAGYGVMLLSWRRILCDKGTASLDRHENAKTVSRDVLHNLVYPRSAPGSPVRYESFAASILSA